jgi:cyclopropane-fatty-acyl-phospholipid synthase
MNSLATASNWQRYMPLVGDIHLKNRFAYLATRSAVAVVNTAQMALAEAYINGLEVPDSVLEGLFNACMPILFKYFPALLTPYEWVLQESDRLAEGSGELMQLQYNLPQKMFSLMLGESKLIYPKYSMALWEKDAIDLEEAQIQMMEDAIEKLEIKDGDRILDVGCGWGSFANYVLSRFPNVKVTGLNLSSMQCDYMRQKMQSVDSYLGSDRFTLIEGDFNRVELNEKFDRVISIGLFCHVSNLTKAFRKIASFMQPNGKFLLHIITLTFSRHQPQAVWRGILNIAI